MRNPLRLRAASRGPRPRLHRLPPHQRPLQHLHLHCPSSPLSSLTVPERVKSLSSGISRLSLSGSAFDTRLSSASAHDGGSLPIEKVVLWVLNNWTDD